VVPRTQCVGLSHGAFYYTYLQKETARVRGRELPEKLGSFQVFLKGFEDAKDFLRRHPWPGRSTIDTLGEDVHRKGVHRSWYDKSLRWVCGSVGGEEEEELSVGEKFGVGGGGGGGLVWTENLMLEFRGELEKLVVLDVLMRNTDRGLDNFMVKFCPGAGKASDSVAGNSGYPQTEDDKRKPHFHIAAIDNSLAFPQAHPSGWRSFLYGWCWLPAVGRRCHPITSRRLTFSQSHS
jgi:phosphatidylinositol 4-kinase type 2